ncbi:TPA: DUF2591 family protein [Morganella morganii]|uniref:phage protein NinX family protein n=1 Tax=Morganella morganii TaxID=582 RepID=UPI00053808A6|nr:phage protein NinX family protein [Morganella morganii]AUT98745.1 DUF2591 domain-containing protein [Morganella morganii]HDU8566915.1 DUF2591 family protein [Morganella morganii]
MNKYRDKSDFEINKAVAVALGAYEVATDIFIDKNRRYEFDKPKSQFFFDPCNNPADAMPIVIRSLISLISDKSDDGESAWWVAQDVTGSIASGLKSNPYRAAMELFLLMKDAENEKS